MSIFFPELEDLVSPLGGQDLKPSPSARSISTAKKSSKRTSGLLPTPRSSEASKQPMDANRKSPCLSWVVKSAQTSETSMEPPTEEQLYLPEGFLASHFPRPGSEEARKMTATSGRRCSELYMKPGPLGCLVRTLLESSTWSSTECFLTWKVKATPCNHLLFQLAPSMPNTEETECGLWPTVHGISKDGKSNGPSGKELGRAVNQRLWATPHTPNGGRVNTEEEILNRGTTERGKRQVSLESQVKMWPTPQA